MKEKTIHSLTAANEITHVELRNLLIFTVVISLFLSLSQHIADSVINSDGILYLYLASLIQEGDWQSATKAYNWLFYPYLISQISTLTTLSLEYSAYILNSFLTALTCAVFIIIVKEFAGKNKILLYCASLVILCYPNLNEYRNMVIRDHGYWAFYLLSVYFFLQAYKKTTLRAVISLTFFTTLATLFRVEGIIFLLLLPLLLLFRSVSSAGKLTIATTLILLVTLLSTLIYSHNYEHINLRGFTKFDQIEHILSSFGTSVSSALNSTEKFINTLSTQGFSNDYAFAVLAFLFILILLTEIVSATSPLYAIFLVPALFFSRTTVNHQVIRPWAYLIAIHIIILVGFLSSRYFLAGRYPIPLALTLIIPLPFLLQLAYQQLQKKAFSPIQANIVKITTVLFIILTLDSLISTGASKAYLKDAGQWIAASNKNQDISLFTNDQFVSFYSGHQNGKRIREPRFKAVIQKINNGKLNQFDLLAIQVSRKNTTGVSTLLNSLKTKPVKIFNNRKGDSVLIFKQ